MASGHFGALSPPEPAPRRTGIANYTMSNLRKTLSQVAKVLSDALNASADPKTSDSSQQPKGTDPAKAILSSMLSALSEGKLSDAARDALKKMDKSITDEAKVVEASFKDELKSMEALFANMDAQFKKAFQDLKESSNIQDSVDRIKATLNPDNINGVDKSYQFKKSVIAHGDSKKTTLKLVNKNVRILLEFNASKSENGKYALDTVAVRQDQFVGDTWQPLKDNTYVMADMKEKLWNSITVGLSSELKSLLEKAMATIRQEHNDATLESSSAPATSETTPPVAPTFYPVNLTHSNWLDGLSRDTVFEVLRAIYSRSGYPLSEGQAHVLYHALWAIQARERVISAKFIQQALYTLADQAALRTALHNIMVELYVNVSQERALYFRAKLDALHPELSANPAAPTLLSFATLYQQFAEIDLAKLDAAQLLVQDQPAKALPHSLVHLIAQGVKFGIATPKALSPAQTAVIRHILQLQYEEHAPKGTTQASATSTPATSQPVAPVPQAPVEHKEVEPVVAPVPAEPLPQESAAPRTGHNAYPYLQSVLDIFTQNTDDVVAIKSYVPFYSGTMKTNRMRVAGQNGYRIQITGLGENDQPSKTILYVSTIQDALVAEDSQVSPGISQALKAVGISVPSTHTDYVSIIKVETLPTDAYGRRGSADLLHRGRLGRYLPGLGRS